MRGPPGGAGSRPRASARRARRRRAARRPGADRPSAVRQATTRTGVALARPTPHASARAGRSARAGAPLASTRPSASTTTRGHSAATSSVWWVDTRIARSSPSSESSSRKRSRCSGSRPAVGSSRISSRGSPSSACASASRRRMPPDSARMRLPADVGEADAREHAADLVVARPALGVLLEDRDVVDELERREARVEAGLLRHVAEPAPDLRALARVARVAAEQAHVARVGREHGGEDAHQRRLARAVGAEQAGDAARRAGGRRRAAPASSPSRLVTPVASRGHRALQPSRRSRRSDEHERGRGDDRQRTRAAPCRRTRASASPGRTAPAIVAASQMPGDRRERGRVRDVGGEREARERQAERGQQPRGRRPAQAGQRERADRGQHERRADAPRRCAAAAAARSTSARRGPARASGRARARSVAATPATGASAAMHRNSASPRSPWWAPGDRDGQRDRDRTEPGERSATAWRRAAARRAARRRAASAAPSTNPGPRRVQHVDDLEPVGLHPRRVDEPSRPRPGSSPQPTMCASTENASASSTSPRA